MRKGYYDLMRVHLLVVAVGLLPNGRLSASEISGEYSTARQLYEARRYAEAREIFARLAQNQPENANLDFYLGRLALWFDDSASALAHLERAARKSPENARIRNALGDAYGLMAQQASLLAKFGWARRCLAEYQAAVQLEPGNAKYRWSLLGFYCMAPRIAGGGCEKALEQVEMISRIDPAEGRMARATYLLSQEQPDAAIAVFETTLAHNPEDYLALFQVGRCAAIGGVQLDRGRQALEKCLTLSPPGGDGMPTLAHVHFRLGNLCEKLGEPEQASRHYVAAKAIMADFKADKDALRN